MFLHKSPFEHVADAPASLAQHEEPPEAEKYVDVHRFDRMSHVFVEQILPSLQSLLDVHAQFVSIPVWHDLNPTFSGSARQALCIQRTVEEFAHCERLSQQFGKRAVGTQLFEMQSSSLHRVGVDGQPLVD
jgi:hypothetical protein